MKLLRIHAGPKRLEKIPFLVRINVWGFITLSPLPLAYAPEKALTRPKRERAVDIVLSNNLELSCGTFGIYNKLLQSV